MNTEEYLQYSSPNNLEAAVNVIWCYIIEPEIKKSILYEANMRSSGDFFSSYSMTEKMSVIYLFLRIR